MSRVLGDQDDEPPREQKPEKRQHSQNQKEQSAQAPPAQAAPAQPTKTKEQFMAAADNIWNEYQDSRDLKVT